ncbi:MAG: hypothetical protein ACLFVU_00630 [Phycisphaerae bacterium]
MKELLKKLMASFLVALFAVGTVSVLPGCEDDDDPVEETTDELEEETD